jgi:hypothetical protein
MPNLTSPTKLLVTFLILASASAALADDQTPQPVLDAETHPYGVAIGSGAGVVAGDSGTPGPHGLVYNLEDLRNLLILIRNAAIAKQNHGDYEGALKLIEKNEAYKVGKRIASGDALARGDVFQIATQAAQTETRDYLVRTITEPGKAYLAVQAGGILSSDALASFVTVAGAFPELRPYKDDLGFHVALGFSGSLIPVLRSSGNQGTPFLKRGEVNLSAGYADRLIVTASAARYYGPNDLDLGMRATTRVGTLGFLGPRRTDNAENFKTTKVNLNNYVRPGDMWFEVGARSLSGPSFAGSAVEGVLTIGLPANRVNDDLRLTPTISLCATYCAQHNLGVDEGALEARLPVYSKLLGKPFFIAGRYGTRGDGSLTFQIRF